ncbi:MAG: spondin domain-containing protein [Pseudomonadota bacterium]
MFASKTLPVAVALLLGVGAAAEATTLKITVENKAEIGGITLTPLYTAFHNGGFDPFNVGEAASPGLQEIAEEGSPGGIAAERQAAFPTSDGVAVFGTDGFPGAPVIEPGEVASATVNVDSANRFFTFLSMVLPSNDTFIGQDDPTAYEVFSSAGDFLGTQVIQVTGANIYDAGTEANLTDGSPFVPSLAGTTRTDEGGVVTPGQSLLNFAGLTVANGQVIDGALFDYLSDPAGFAVAEIRIEVVPIPASLPLLAAGLGLLGWSSRRRKGAT